MAAEMGVADAAVVGMFAFFVAIGVLFLVDEARKGK